MADGHRFASPDQLGAARAEAPPAPTGQVARLAGSRAVPALHGQDTEAVADTDWTVDKRLSKRRLRGCQQRIVEAEIDARRLEVTPEEICVLERRDADIPGLAHAGRSRFS